MRNILIICGILIFSPSTVFGVAGVGDLSYDPAVHAELMAAGKIAVDTYESTIEFLDKASEINDSINRAYGAYEDARNFNLKEYTLKYRNGFSNSDGSIGGKISNARYGLSGTKDNLVNDYDNINYQKTYIDDLRSLLNLDKAAKSNADKSGSANPGQASVITSQNTSITTILAVDEAAARKEQELIDKAGQKKMNTFNKNQENFDRNLYKVFEQE